MTRIAELVERVKAATGPDRELDALVFAACGYEVNPKNGEYVREPGEDTYSFSPRISESIDAALALCKRVLGNVWWFMSKGRMTITEPLFAVSLIPVGNTEGDTLAEAEAATLPLAILLAILLSLESAP